MLNLFRLLRQIISVGEGLIFEIFRLRGEVSQLTSEITKLREELHPDLRAVTWTVGDPQEEVK